jgi:hypothetical protein
MAVRGAGTVAGTFLACVFGLTLIVFVGKILRDIFFIKMDTVVTPEEFSDELKDDLDALDPANEDDYHHNHPLHPKFSSHQWTTTKDTAPMTDLTIKKSVMDKEIKGTVVNSPLQLGKIKLPPLHLHHKKALDAETVIDVGLVISGSNQDHEAKPKYTGTVDADGKPHGMGVVREEGCVPCTHIYTIYVHYI